MASLDPFTYYDPLRLLVCTKCKYCVWPQHLSGHIRDQHAYSSKEAQRLADTIRQRFPDAVEQEGWKKISMLETPIPMLPVIEDKYKCTMPTSEAEECTFIGTEDSMRGHWRAKHRIESSTPAGGPGVAKQARVAAKREQGRRSVRCQRLFNSAGYNGYVEIPQAVVLTEEQVLECKDVFEDAWSSAELRYKERRECSDAMVRVGKVDEVNPWLRRTGWVEYMAGFTFIELRQLTVDPTVDSFDRGVETAAGMNRWVELAVWFAAGTLFKQCQQAVVQSGVLVRVEAVKTAAYEDKHKPLSPYQDLASVDSHGRVWKRMLMFFVRANYGKMKAPAHRFTPDQDTKFWRMIACAESQKDGEVESEQLSPLHESILEFCIALLNQRQDSSEYEMALVCAAALLGVDSTYNAWKSVMFYPTMLSSMIKIARFMVMKVARMKSGIDERKTVACVSAMDLDTDCVLETPLRPIVAPYDSGVGLGSSPASSPIKHHRPSHRRTTLDWIVAMNAAFMTRGTGSPMHTLLSLRTYGRMIQNTTTAEGFVNWISDRELEFKGHRISMDDFRGMVLAMLSNARRLLCEVLECQSKSDLPIIPWSSILDNPRKETVGWNVLQNDGCNWPVDGKTWLKNRIKRRGLGGEWTKRKPCGGWNAVKIKAWLRKVAEFRTALLLLMHVTGGQPARGPEILSLRHCNTVNGETRNIFVENAQVVFVTRYHKGYSISGDAKVIHRYLPRDVGELLLWHLWLVLPFQHTVSAAIDDDYIPSDHLFSSGFDRQYDMTTSKMARALSEVSRAHTTMPLNVQDYRMVSIAINRRQIIDAKAQFQTDSPADAIEGDEDDDENDLQAAHSSHTAGNVYARDVAEGRGVTKDLRERFRGVSNAWHEFLRLDSSKSNKRKSCDDATPVKRQKAEAVEDEVESGSSSAYQDARRVRLMGVNAKEVLKKMYGDGAVFRGVQEQAVNAVLRGDSHILVVMATGGGKSLLFMLPALASSDGVSVVIVPLLSLREDILMRCEALRIKCSIFEGVGSIGDARIVLVTPEEALKPTFQQQLALLKGAGDLDRIVIDECHVMLDPPGCEFREQLRKLGTLAQWSTQMVLLTATLPPVKYDLLLQRMYWEKDEVTEVRCSTSRSNIRYRVCDGAGSGQKRLLRLKDVIAESAVGGGKLLIMCESQHKTEEIADASEMLGVKCKAFHGGLTRERRRELLEEIRSGAISAIAGTGAFGVGVDIPGVRTVIHFDNPRNLMEFAQYSGRCGRDGGSSQSIVMTGGRRFEDAGVDEYLSGSLKTCRRVLLGRYLDGDHSRVSCRVGEEMCDVCEAASREREFLDDIADEEFFSMTTPAIHSSSPFTVSKQHTLDSPLLQKGNAMAVERLPHPAPIVSSVPKRADSGPIPPPVFQASSSLLRGKSGSGRAERAYAAMMANPMFAKKALVSAQNAGRRASGARLSAEQVVLSQRQKDMRDRLVLWAGVCAMCLMDGQEDFRHSVLRCKRKTKTAYGMIADELVMQLRMNRTTGLSIKTDGSCWTCAIPELICIAESGSDVEHALKDVVTHVVPPLELMLPSKFDALLNSMNPALLDGANDDNRHDARFRSAINRWYGQGVREGHTNIYDVFMAMTDGIEVPSV